MKKYAIVIFSIFLILLAVASIGGFMYQRQKSLDNIPSLEQIKQYGDEWGYEKLRGYSQEQLVSRWGTPDMMLFGLPGEYWYIGDSLEHVTIYYNSDEKVMGVHYQLEE